MTKVNIATQLNKVFTAAVRRTLAAEPATVDPRKYGAAGRDAVAPEVARLLRLLGGGDADKKASAGPRAPAVGASAQAGGTGDPLSPVE
jgi:fructose-bisphosphate aldolase class II